MLIINTFSKDSVGIIVLIRCYVIHFIKVSKNILSVHSSLTSSHLYKRNNNYHRDAGPPDEPVPAPSAVYLHVCPDPPLTEQTTL